MVTKCNNGISQKNMTNWNIIIPSTLPNQGKLRSEIVYFNVRRTAKLVSDFQKREA